MDSAAIEAPPSTLRATVLGIVMAGLIGIAAIAPVVYRLAWHPPRMADAGGDVVIEYMAWGTPSQLASDREVIRRFNERCAARGMHERVELFMPPAGGYTQKLLMMLASDTAPDVARVDHFDFASMAVKGYFRDLTDLAAKDPEFHPRDFHAAPLRENMYHDRLLGLNVVFGGMICYYNADLFRHAGLADPYTLWKAGRWDWAAFDDAAHRLTTTDAAGRPISFGMLVPAVATGPTPIDLGVFLWRFGGDYLSADHSHSLLGSPADIKAMQYLRDMVFKSKVAPAAGDQAASMFSFESGNVAMTFATAGNSPQYRDNIRDFDWDIAPTPSDPDNTYQLVKGCQLVVTAQSKHPQQAWEWVKYLTSEETEKYLYGDTFRRNVPTRLAVLNSSEFLHASRSPFHTDIYAYLLDHARELPIDESWPVWTSTAQRFIQRLFVDPSAETAAVLKEAAAAVDIDLQEQRARRVRYGEVAVGGSGVH